MSAGRLHLGLERSGGRVKSHVPLCVLFIHAMLTRHQVQGLMKKSSDGHAYWAYGGDYGEHVHDAMWNINGLTWPDGSWHPSCFQVKKTLCPIRISIQWRQAGQSGAQHAAVISFTTGFEPEVMSSLGWKWVLEIDGEMCSAGELRAFPMNTISGLDGVLLREEVELGPIFPLLSTDVEGSPGLGRGKEAVLTVSTLCDIQDSLCAAGNTR